MEELVQAIYDALNAEPIRPEGAWRTEELAKTLGLGIHKTRIEIKKLMDKGLVEHIEVPYVNMRNRTVTTSAYRWIKTE